MRMHLALLMTGVLVVACSAGDTETSTTPAPADTTTSAPTSTTSTSAEPTTSTASPTSTVPASTTSVVVALAPDGSGCNPGGDGLTDGLWYGLVADFDAEGISFDLACWFTGDAATAAAAEDGQESPPPNDYYVRNQNELLRDLTVDPDTSVLWYLSGDPNDSEQGTFSEWVDFGATQELRLGIWVTITDDQVTQIEEQWVP